MAITCTNLTNALTTTNATSYTADSVTFPKNTLVNLYIANTHGADATLPTPTTTGLVWQQGATIQSGSSRRLTRFFTEVGNSDVTATTLIDFGASTATGCGWSIDTITGVGQGAMFGNEVSRTATGTAVSGLTLILQQLTANSGVLCAVSALVAEAITEESGWTGELAEPTAVANPNHAFEVSYFATADTTPAPTWTTSVSYNAIAVEIISTTPGRVINPYIPNQVTKII